MHNLSRYRSVGLTLVAVGLIGFAVALPVAAFHAGSHQFDRIAGWSTILAFSVAAAGLALMVADRNRRVEGTLSKEALNRAADQLAAQVLNEEGVQRARLLGADAVTITAANVGFVRADRLVEFADASTGSSGDLNTVVRFYEQESSRRLIILGEPGSGKTVLALELLVGLLEQRPGGTAAFESIPVRLSLPTWNTDQPFTGWLAAQLTARYGLAAQVASGLITLGCILPVLDGLDEMDPEKGPPIRAAAAVSQLNEYIAGTTGRPLVITCRTADYARISTSIRPAATIRIRPLSAERIVDYLRREVRDRDGHAAWDDWDDLIRELHDPDDQRVLDLLQTPWRLVLAVTFYRGGGSPRGLLPSAVERPICPRSSQQYAARVSGILLDAFIPARTKLYGHNDYTPEQAKHWLASLAAYLHDRADDGLSGSDIVLTQCWQIADVHRLKRWHAAIAIALTCLAVSFIFTLRSGGVVNYVIDVHYYLTSSRHLPISFLIVSIVDIVTLVTLPWMAADGVLNIKRQPWKVNLQQLRTYQGRKKLATSIARWLAISFMTGIAIGLGIGVVGWAAYGLAIGVDAGIAAALSIGLAGGLAVGLAVGLAPSENAATGDPLDALRSDFAVGVAVGLAAGIPIGLVASFVGVPAIGLVNGLAIGIASGLVGGLVFLSKTSCRYLIAVSLAARARLLPLRFARFLNWAYRAGILRISGDAYQFRHSELRDRLQLQRATRQR